jgi:hypothetical protein
VVPADQGALARGEAPGMATKLTLRPHHAKFSHGVTAYRGQGVRDSLRGMGRSPMELSGYLMAARPENPRQGIHPLDLDYCPAYGHQPVVGTDRGPSPARGVAAGRQLS